LAEGCDLQADVADVMCEELYFVHPSDDVTRAFEIMQDRQLGWLPVVDESGELVGILNLGDLATRA
jgi:CBS domain-containing protein